jgi:hypothetical protein
MGHIALELASKTRYSRKDSRDGKMRKKTKAATEWPSENAKVLVFERESAGFQHLRISLFKGLWNSRTTDFIKNEQENCTFVDKMQSLAILK